MLAGLIKKATVFLGENSPEILTAVGVVGTVSTAVLTAKATVKTIRDYDTREQILEGFEGSDLTKWEKFVAYGPNYIPPVVVGGATVTSIIMANRISSKKMAALAIASTISERALQQYKDKVVEKLGEAKATSVQDAIAQDKVNATPIGTKEIILAGTGEVLCFDMYSGRYFQSSVEEIKKAENNLNFNLVNNMNASLSEFYQDVGLPPNGSSEYVGWNSDQMVHITISAVMSPDNRPCMAIDFSPNPNPDYQKLHY